MQSSTAHYLPNRRRKRWRHEELPDSGTGPDCRLRSVLKRCCTSTSTARWLARAPPDSGAPRWTYPRCPFVCRETQGLPGKRVSHVKHRPAPGLPITRPKGAFLCARGKGKDDLARGLAAESALLCALREQSQFHTPPINVLACAAASKHRSLCDGKSALLCAAHPLFFLPTSISAWHGCTQKSTFASSGPSATNGLSSFSVGGVTQGGSAVDRVPVPLQPVRRAWFSDCSTSRTSASFLNTFKSQQAFRAQNLL